jgi:hypothetical protein
MTLSGLFKECYDWQKVMITAQVVALHIEYETECPTSASLRHGVVQLPHLLQQSVAVCWHLRELR